MHLKRVGGPGCQHQRSCGCRSQRGRQGDGLVVDKDDGKQAKSKPKWSTCCSKKKKEDSSKIIEPLDDNVMEYFGPSQSLNSQETVDVTPINTPKKSEEAKLKNDPDGSSHRRVDKSPKPSSKLKQPARSLHFPAAERSTSCLEAQLGRVHPNLLSN